MRKPWLIAAVVGVVIVGGGAAVLARGGIALSSAAEKKPPVAVTLEFTAAEVVQPVLTSMPEQVVFSGPLVAPRTAIVRSKASGTLLSLTVAEGSRVRAGQVLGVIDVSDLQSRVAERDAGVESAQARLAEVERIHASNQDLARQHFISSNALESSRAAFESARAQLKSTQAQLATASLGLREAKLVAPIGGLIGKRSVLPGEKVSAEQELLTVVDLQQLELGGVVGTHQVARLQAGEPVTVQVEGQTEVVSGRIDRISPSALAGTRGIQVVVALPNPKEQLRAGLYASASVSLPDANQRLTVPLSALGQASGQDFLWTIEKGVLVRRIVITGRKDVATGRVEVVRGLPSDASVLAARFDNLKEGAAARVLPQRGPSASVVAPIAAVKATSPVAVGAETTATVQR